MGDIDDRDAEIVAQRLEQVDDRHPQRRIDHRHRLVGDDQLRIGEQRAGDGDALQLPAGKLVRIATAHLLQRQPDLAQGLVDGRPRCSAWSPAAMKPAPRHEQIAVELLQRIEGLERILEDRLHLVHEGHAVGACFAPSPDRRRRTPARRWSAARCSGSSATAWSCRCRIRR